MQRDFNPCVPQSGVPYTLPPNQCAITSEHSTRGPRPSPTHPTGGRVMDSLQKTCSMGIRGSSSHFPVGLPRRDHLRCGTHPPHHSKGSFHCLLLSATNVCTRTNVQGTRRPNHRAATSCPHPRRGPTWHLGWHLPKVHTYRISTLQEMERAHDAYIPTMPTARPIGMHRHSHYLGSLTHNPPGW